jgi:CHAD domain-containing protein
MMSPRGRSPGIGTAVFAVDSGVAPERLLPALEAEGAVTVARPVSLRRSYLDTFDWRVWKAGGRLLLEGRRGRRVLRWQPEGAAPMTAPAPESVRFAEDLPDGAIRRELARIIEMRALLPMGEVRLRQRLVRALDEEGKTVARVRWEEAASASTAGPRKHAPATLRLEVLVGYERAGERIRRRLLALPGVSPGEDGELARAAAARGRIPGDYSSKPAIDLDPATPVAEAACLVLRHLLATVRANLDGVVEDVDTEFLHDLRVAVRRTRAALGQLEGVVDPERVARYAEELRWLGNATGPCRDLDVFLLDLQGYRQGLAPEVSTLLAPFAEHLRRQRASAHARLARELRSRRCARLLRRWEGFLAGGDLTGTAEAARPVRAVAAERVQRAYRRLLKHARRLGPRPLAEGMHRLRIDAKKLRYLLELFASALEGESVDTLVRQLKAIQDTLGAYHDLHLQRLRVAKAGRAMQSGGGVPADTLLAMGRLAALMEDRQEAHHRDFARRFAAFSAKEVAAAVAGLGAAEVASP